MEAPTTQPRRAVATRSPPGPPSRRASSTAVTTTRPLRSARSGSSSGQASYRAPAAAAVRRARPNDTHGLMSCSCGKDADRPQARLRGPHKGHDDEARMRDSTAGGHPGVISATLAAEVATPPLYELLTFDRPGPLIRARRTEQSEGSRRTVQGRTPWWR